MKVVSVDCIDRHHIIARCPQCGIGVTMVTCKNDFNGIAETNCNDCNSPLALYIIMEEHRAWMLGLPIDMVTKKVT